MDDLRNLRGLVDRYLARELSLESFEDEFVPLVPQFAQLPSDNDAARMASNIELWLAEMSQGHRPESELRSLLEAHMAAPAVVHLTIGDVVGRHESALSATQYRTFESASLVIVDVELPSRAVSAAETRLMSAPLKDREASGSAADTQRATVPA